MAFGGFLVINFILGEFNLQMQSNSNLSIDINYDNYFVLFIDVMLQNEKNLKPVTAKDILRIFAKYLPTIFLSRHISIDKIVGLIILRNKVTIHYK